MENEEILQKLSKLEKKQDKILNLLTKIAKTLHLLPVTEKEERDIQVQQRTNLNQAAKISAQLDEMENKTTKTENALGINIFSDMDDADVYADVIGKDILG